MQKQFTLIGEGGKIPQSTYKTKEVNTTQANSGNGDNPQPQIEKVYEPLDEERWVEKDEETGRREIAFSDQVRDELGIEDEDEQSESN